MRYTIRIVSALNAVVGGSFFIAPFVLYETPFHIWDTFANSMNFLYLAVFLTALNAHNLYRLAATDEYNIGGLRISMFLGTWGMIASVITPTFTSTSFYLLSGGSTVVAVSSLIVCLVSNDPMAESASVQPAD